MHAPKTEKQVRGFLGRLNYISRFISHMSATCAPIFKLLRKGQSCDWTEDCERAFDSIKEYLLEPPILSPPVEGRPLIMYLTVLEDSMGCVLGQQDETGRKNLQFTTSIRNSPTVRLDILCLRKLVAHWLGLLSVCASVC